MLSVSIARKDFAGRVVLKDLAFTLASGELVALVGPSGCGKSTLLRIVGGLDRDFDGRIDWEGGIEPRIGTVFQEPRLLPWRTVRQNLELVARPEAGERLLRTLGLWEARDQFPRALSLGMQRRAAIARAFAIEPDLVLLDEPFVSLDRAMVAASRDVLLAAWRERPIGVLFVTHDEAEARLLADRVLTLSSGPACVVGETAISQERAK